MKCKLSYIFFSIRPTKMYVIKVFLLCVMNENINIVLLKLFRFFMYFDCNFLKSNPFQFKSNFNSYNTCNIYNDSIGRGCTDRAMGYVTEATFNQTNLMSQYSLKCTGTLLIFTEPHPSLIGIFYYSPPS